MGEIRRRKSPDGVGLDLPPTAESVRAITRMAMALGIREPIEEGISNRREARKLQYELLCKLRARRKEVTRGH